MKLHNINNVAFFNTMEILLHKDSPLKETREKAIAYATERQIDLYVVRTVKLHN